jgi:MFS transporter, DHA2 family, multidrug resistance protein
MDLFRNRAFNAALGANVLNVFVSFGSFILISQYLQLVLGLSPLHAGLLSLPASLLAIAGPMLSPMLQQRFGTATTVAALLAIAGVGFGVLTFVGGPLATVLVGVGWTLWALGGSAAATVTTGTIISAARPERAGAVSAVAQTGAELGGALGIAILGSLGTAIYRGAVAGALPDGISPELAAAARDTLGGAMSVASQLSDATAAANLVFVAQDALTLALHIVCGLGAVISIASALAAAYYLRPATDEPNRQSHCEAEAVMTA